MAANFRVIAELHQMSNNNVNDYKQQLTTCQQPPISQFRCIWLKTSESCYLAVMITSAQCRAARGLLDWTQQELANRARVGVVTVRQFEAGDVTPRRATLQVIQHAFALAGVALISG